MKFHRYYQSSQPTQPRDINSVITCAVEGGFFTQAAKTKQKKNIEIRYDPTCTLVNYKALATRHYKRFKITDIKFSRAHILTAPVTGDCGNSIW